MRAVARLRRVATMIADLDPDCAWVAQVIDRRLAGEVASLDAAFGLVRRGGLSLPREIQNDRRNAVLREFADRFLHQVTPSARADALAKELFQFRSRVWPRLVAREECPPDLIGTRHGALFDLFKIDDTPIGKKQISRLIG